MVNYITRKVEEYLREMHESLNPFYHGAGTNAAGGILFGLFSNYFNPRIVMPHTFFHVMLRMFLGSFVGIAFSLGALFLSLPYIEDLSRIMDRWIRRDVLEDLIYGFLSLWLSIVALLSFGFLIFSVYGWRIPVNNLYITYSWFISSLTYTRWNEIFLIPIFGVSVKMIYKMLLKIVEAVAAGEK